MVDSEAEPSMQKEEQKHLKGAMVRQIARFHMLMRGDAGELLGPQDDPVDSGQRKLREILANIMRWVYWAASDQRFPLVVKRRVVAI